MRIRRVIEAAASLALLVLTARTAGAADTVELLDGSKISGTVTEATEESVSIRTRYGMSMTVPAARVHKVETSAGTKVYNEKPEKPRPKPAAPKAQAASSSGSPRARPLRGGLRIGELELEPVVLTLRNGVKVPGYHALETADRLVVYSPRLATLRSFPKRDVGSISKSSRRAIAGMHTGFWPDEPPKTGFEPPYTMEKWGPPKRLLVWRNPGETGRFDEPSNWLENGEPMTRMEAHHYEVEKGRGVESRGDATLDAETDIIFPYAEERYGVKGVSHHQRGSYLCRHLTVENNASFGHNLAGGFGNFWITREASFSGGGCAVLRGTKHTFLSCGERRAKGTVSGPQEMAGIETKGFARKWILRKDDPNVTMEVIGGVGSGDETHTLRGTLVISENSSVLFGARCVYNVREEGVLQLQDGAVFSMIGNCTYRPDMVIRGKLRAGSPERPIERDCYVGLGFKDVEDSLKNKHHARAPKEGLLASPGSEMLIFSKDPEKARLVFTFHGREGNGERGVPKHGEQRENYDALPRKMSMVLCGNALLNGVAFDYVRKGGIQLARPGLFRRWKNVVFGEHNDGGLKDLVTAWNPSAALREAVDGYFGRR
jgi:hypothetical protein